jgi:hypothetical protein
MRRDFNIFGAFGTLLLLLAAVVPVVGQSNSRTEVERDFLNYGIQNPYRNYAFEPFVPPPVFGWSAPRYDRLGRYTMQGRVMLSADEQRPGLSKIDGLRFETLNVFSVGASFNYTVLQDSYEGRNYAMMVLLDGPTDAAPVKARFSPLTLNMTRYTGVRFDVNGPKNKATFLYTRGAGDRSRFSLFTTGRDERSPVILWGGHWETQIGSAFKLGSTFVNQHMLDTRAKKGNILEGNLANNMLSPELIAVRVVDDSPDDPTAPAAAYGIDVIIKGRDPEGNPRTITNAEALATGGIEWEPGLDPGAPAGRAADLHWEAAGPDESIEFTFRLPADFEAQEARFHARVGGDYRLQVRQEHPHEFTRIIAGRPRPSSQTNQWPGNSFRRPGEKVEQASFEGDAGNLQYPTDFKFPEIQPAYTVRRSEGIPRHLDERLVSFDYGFPTAQSLASVSLDVDYAGVKLNGEVSFNVQNFKFPFRDGRRHTKKATAYYLTARRPLPRVAGRAPSLGLELYRIPADYSGNYDSRRGGAVFHTDVPIAPPNTAITQEFNLFDDNDDGDQWPDDMPNDTPLAGQNDAGVFPGLDENNDNVPDTDQNSNGIPDWDEPFLFFWSDPPEFIYDIDMNNNGLPDMTENDDRPDYPYRRDQQGYHAFVGFDEVWARLDRLSLGYYHSKGLASGGRSRSTYLRWQASPVQSPRVDIVFKGDIKRVRDSISDPTFIWRTSSDPRANALGLQQLSGLYPLLDLRDPDADTMLMRSSTVATAHVGGDWHLGENLDLRQRYKWHLNRQHKETFADGNSQRAQSLSRLTLSHRVEYRYPYRSNITFKARLRHLYWRDAGYPRDLRRHWSTYGLLFEQEFKLTQRTMLVAGQEGIPGLLPVRHTEHHTADGDFNRWTDVLMLRMRGAYLGWDTVTELGFEYQRIESDTGDVSNRTFFLEMFFGF